MPGLRWPLHVLAAGAGAAAGLLGSLVHPLRLASLPVGLGCGLALSAAVFVGSGLAVRGRTGAGAAALGWAVPVLVLSTPRPEGDLVVTGSVLGYAWLVGGLVVAGLAAAPAYHSGQPSAGGPDRR